MSPRRPRTAFPSAPVSAAALAALLLAGPGCTCGSDPVDKAAKERIFSPEDPPQVVSSAQEKLAPQDVATDPRVARRVLGMDAAEVTERLGAHRYTATVTTEWLGPDQQSVTLTETRTLRAGKGGVAGDFHGVLENSRDQGLEVLRVKGQVFARSRYGTFRERKRDRGMAERTRAELTGALRDVDALFRGRLQLAPQGTATVEGRTAWRYTVSLAPEGTAAPAGEATGELPPLLAPRNGADATTQRRLRFYEKRVPRALEGEVFIDDATSVVLKARLDGRLVVPATEKEGPAELRLTVEQALTELGQEPGLKVPESFLPDVDKPKGIADALDRFGVPRGGADAGVAAPGAAPEPPDDEEGGQ